MRCLRFDFFVSTVCDIRPTATLSSVKDADFTEANFQRVFHNFRYNFDACFDILMVVLLICNFTFLSQNGFGNGSTKVTKGKN